MSPGPGTQHLGLMGKRRDTRANHGRQGQNRQEHLKGSARAPGVLITGFQSSGVGFCTHHCGAGVASTENEQQRKSCKQSSWRLQAD